MWNFILKLLTPFVKWWSTLHFPWTQKKITGDEYYLWRDFISEGYIILTKTEGELSNFINPTEVKHSAIYVGTKEESPICYVAEALREGVITNNLVKHMTTKDVLIVVKPKFGTPEQLKMVAQSAKNYVGLSYDWIFEKGNDSLYCFELCIKAYNDVFPNKMFKCKEIVKGKRIYTEDTFLGDPDNWEVIVDSRKYFEEKK